MFTTRRSKSPAEAAAAKRAATKDNTNRRKEFRLMVYSLWFGAVRRSTIRGGLKYVAVSTVFESAPNTYIAHTLGLRKKLVGTV